MQNVTKVYKETSPKNYVNHRQDACATIVGDVYYVIWFFLKPQINADKRRWDKHRYGWGGFIEVVCGW
jgi:hypothetical protein